MAVLRPGRAQTPILLSMTAELDGAFSLPRALFRYGLSATLLLSLAVLGSGLLAGVLLLLAGGPPSVLIPVGDQLAGTGVLVLLWLAAYGTFVRAAIRRDVLTGGIAWAGVLGLGALLVLALLSVWARVLPSLLF